MKGLLVLLMVFISGCFASSTDMAIQRAMVVSNAAVLSVEAAQTSAEAFYSAEQEAVVGRARETGAPRQEVIQRVQEVRFRWAPVWAAFDKVRTAHTALVLALQLYDSGRQKDLPRVLSLLDEFLSQQQQLADLISRTRNGG